MVSITSILTPEWLSAIGTIGAVLIVLFREAFKAKPDLRILLQTQGGTERAFWHSSVSMLPVENAHDAVLFEFSQSRVWVKNEGRVDARDARVKLSIIDPDLGGRDSPLEFVLPVFVYYRPRLDSNRRLLAAPGADEVAVDIASHSQEAFELVFHHAGAPDCNPYTRTGFPLLANKGYSLELVAYANDVKPTKPAIFTFKWDGREESLPDAIRRA
ncbi:MAG TPA: hypothetical protein VGS04_01800 [Nitrososphaerales archaeon]|nr:hypothetical protein [Nitrososphaerales archaeon]